MGRKTESILQLIIEAKNLAGKVFRDFVGDLEDAAENVEKLSDAQARAAADPEYLRSNEFLIDRIRELGDQTLRTQKAIRSVTSGLASTDSMSVREYTDSVQFLRDRVDTLELSEKAQIKTQRVVRAEMDKTTKSSNLLGFAIKRLVGLFAIFFTSRAIIRFFRQSIKLFLENQDAAKSLQERVEALEVSWKSLQIAVGSILAESILLDDAEKNLIKTIDDLTDAINANRGAWVKWGRIIVQGLFLVAGSIGNLVDISLQGWKMIGAGASIVFNEIAIGFKTLLNQMQEDIDSAAIFAPQRFIERLLGVERRGGRADTSANKELIAAMRAEIDRLARETNKDLKDIQKAFDDFIEAINAPIGEAPGRFRPKPKKKKKEEVESLILTIDEALAQQESDLGRRAQAFNAAIRDLFEGPVGDPEAIAIFRRSLEDSNAELSKMQRIINDIAGDSLVAFGDAVEFAFAAMASGSITAGEAFKRAMLGAIAAAASAYGDMFFGLAVAAAGFSLLPPPIGSPTGFAAAAKFTAAGVALKAIAGAVGGFAGGGTRGGVGVAGGPLFGRDQIGLDRGDAIIIIEGGVLQVDDPRQMNALARAMENVAGRRVIVRAG